MEQKLSKHFFLISFLPAIAYWYMETRYPLRIALIAGLTLAVVEIILEIIFTREVHTLSTFNFFLILFLGIISLIGNEGLWFKLQPFFTGCAMSGFLSYRLIRGKGMLWEMMESFPSKRPKPPRTIVTLLEKHVAVFFFSYGCFMGSLAVWSSTDRWIFFKTIGFYLAFFVFMAGEMIYLRMRTARMVADPAPLLPQNHKKLQSAPRVPRSRISGRQKKD